MANAKNHRKAIKRQAAHTVPDTIRSMAATTIAEPAVTKKPRLKPRPAYKGSKKPAAEVESTNVVEVPDRELEAASILSNMQGHSSQSSQVSNLKEHGTVESNKMRSAYA